MYQSRDDPGKPQYVDNFLGSGKRKDRLAIKKE